MQVKNNPVLLFLHFERFKYYSYPSASIGLSFEVLRAEYRQRPTGRGCGNEETQAVERMSGLALLPAGIFAYRSAVFDNTDTTLFRQDIYTEPLYLPWCDVYFDNVFFEIVAFRDIILLYSQSPLARS